MSYFLNEQQVKEIAESSLQDRKQNFIDSAVQWNELWSLKDQNGWVTIGDGEDECIPVWPHPSFGLIWAEGDWSDCFPDAIKLESWMENWLPGMQSDDVKILVFPTQYDSGVKMSADDLKHALENASPATE